MAARKPGRYLAPVALIAVLVAVILLVRARADGAHHTTTPPTLTTQHRLPTSRPANSPPTFYVVKASDTLSGISVKTGVPVATLEALNPSINLGALQIGQKIRLRH
jgi:LysM repeat protein